jgi:hypothetical protein
LPKAQEWQRLKALVLDSVSSPITRRVYNMALDEFIGWFRQSVHPGFTKATVSAWRVWLEARGLGSSSIIVRMSAIRKLAAEAADNRLIAPELAAGIARVKSAKVQGIRVGNWLSLAQARALLSAPDRATHRVGGATRPFEASALYQLIQGYMEQLPGAIKEEQLADGSTVSRCLYTPHSLRATRATLLLDASVDIISKGYPHPVIGGSF